MLSTLRARGEALGAAAAERARARLAATLAVTVPEAIVEIARDGVVLTGPVSPDDARLRWIGRLLR